MILVCAGWLVAVLFGDGFELHRSAFAMPLVVLGALCGIVETMRSGRVLWTPALIGGAAVFLYFASRALTSPVWDLGRHDLHLMSLSWLSLVTVATCVTTPRRVMALLATLVLIFLGNLGAGLYQQFGDPDYVFFRNPRVSSHGVSGLFWHWNNLAALLAIALPWFLGIVLTNRSLALRVLLVLFIVLGLWLAYLSKSRAGLGAVVVGLISVGLAILLRLSRSWNWSGRLAAWCGVVVFLLVAAAVMFQLESQVSAARGHGDDLGSALGKSSRFALAGMAFDQWMSSPLVGTGSQTFEYLSIKNWDHETLPGWLGLPETVHNEYMQILCDYGLLGFLMALGFILIVLSRVVIAPEVTGSGRERSILSGFKLGSVGVLLATLVHAVIDFQLHMLPIIMGCGLAIGFLVQGGRKGTLPMRLVHVVFTSAAAVLTVVSVAGESRNTVSWLRFESELVASPGLEPSRLPALRELAETSPHYKVARTYGRLCYTLALLDESGKEKYLKEARWALERAYERHRYDQRTLGYLAITLDQLGEHSLATPIHVQAVEQAGVRENKFGFMSHFAVHLWMRGESLFMQRRPAEALGFWLRSREYLDSSRERKFRYSEYQNLNMILEKRISLLQETGFQPVFPSDIAPPPKHR